MSVLRSSKNEFVLSLIMDFLLSYRRLFSGFLLCLLGLYACEEKNQASNEPIEAASQSALPLLALPHEFKLETSVLRSKSEVKISEDLVLKGEQTYQAFSLRATLSPILEQLEDTTNLELIFVCSDGYEANMKLSDAMKSEGFIADGGWPAAQNAKFTPYYVVWGIEGASKNKKLPWPYGVLSIRLTRSADEFMAAIPPDTVHFAGFEIFKQRCIKCHGINKVGGVLGPELNYPKNITEYWQKEDIWAFIKAPQSYRYSSKMPPQTDLKREDFEKIYAYLVAMKGYQPASRN
ncbi:MAG: cytochrome c [Bacteroidota bacterium]